MRQMMAAVALVLALVAMWGPLVERYLATRAAQ